MRSTFKKGIQTADFVIIVICGELDSVRFWQELYGIEAVFDGSI